MFAVSSELVDEALRGVERVGSWPIQVLNIALYAVVLGIAWLFVKNTRKDLVNLQKSHEEERREYIQSLRTLVQDSSRIIERNSVIFERIDRRLERLEQQKRNGN